MKRQTDIRDGSIWAPPGIRDTVAHLEHIPVRQRFLDRQAHMEEIEPLTWADVLPVRGTRQHWDRVR